jgi:microcystin-dependent protein
MAEPFLGEIRTIGFNFAPVGWALCNGQLLPIAQNTALFTLLGTTYGGDGKRTFALPNLQGRVPVHQGTGTGLSPRALGESAGAESIKLAIAQIPKHNHSLNATSHKGTSAIPAGHVLARGGAYGNAPSNTKLNEAAVGPVGGSEAHDNLQPFLVVNFIIALQGIFPARS